MTLNVTICSRASLSTYMFSGRGMSTFDTRFKRPVLVCLALSTFSCLLFQKGMYISNALSVMPRSNLNNNLLKVIYFNTFMKKTSSQYIYSSSFVNMIFFDVLKLLNNSSNSKKEIGTTAFGYLILFKFTVYSLVSIKN